ncbi:hypothetical protein DZS_09440 [Dickeya ananatis]
MALPRTLKYLNLFNDGNNFMGVVESFTPPKLTRKLEKFRGAACPARLISIWGWTMAPWNVNGRLAAGSR